LKCGEVNIHADCFSFTCSYIPFRFSFCNPSLCRADSTDSSAARKDSQIISFHQVKLFNTIGIQFCSTLVTGDVIEFGFIEACLYRIATRQSLIRENQIWSYDWCLLGVVWLVSNHNAWLRMYFCVSDSRSSMRMGTVEYFFQNRMGLFHDYDWCCHTWLDSLNSQNSFTNWIENPIKT